MGEHFEVTAYEIGTLKQLLAKKAEALPAVVEEKLHILYLDQYFDTLQAETILIENDYVDRDFLEDFAGYYVRCFHKYKSTCTRLHFFTESFATQDFESFLTGENQSLTVELLQNSYLGFIVVKPLPRTIIGRTCLKTYPRNGQRRSYFTRNYEVNLFGVKLTVDTLAYQEQDQVAAACATSALWSVFQGTGIKFHHVIPSPVEITKLATTMPSEAVPGTLPNKGLTGVQIIHAIRKLGLEPQRINIQDEFILKSTVYAYLRAGIPMLMAFGLHDTYSKKPRYNLLRDKHAVAVTGYSIGGTTAVPWVSEQLYLTSSRIDKLYVHDDQVGPFARMIFDGQKVQLKLNGKTVTLNSMSTSWRGGDDKIGSVRAVPEWLFVPLYVKIRIPFRYVKEVILEFDGFIKKLAIRGKLPVSTTLEWDMYLIELSNLKRQVRDTNELPPRYCLEVLLERMPRFIWLAAAHTQGRKVFELLIDATDIEQGFHFIRALEYDSTYSNVIRSAAKVLVDQREYQLSRIWRILEWYAKQP